MQWVQNGSHLGHRGYMTAVGTEWVTPGSPRIHDSGLIFGRFYSRYWVIFPMPKSIFFSQFLEENSQFQIRKKFEEKSSFL